jgi:hypothetical protein
MGMDADGGIDIFELLGLARTASISWASSSKVR